MMPAIAPDHLEDSYRHCESIARRSNFYNGFRLLPPAKRRALSAVYAFMRQCDDISDDDGSMPEKRQQFQNWRAQFEAVMRGEPTPHAILPAFGHTVQRFKIPVEYFHKLIDGTEMDLTTTRYSTFDELYDYCFHVASIVGLVCLHIFGFRQERAKTCAEACGIAFQLTNILRDIKEDLQRDRIYLPLEDLRRFGYSEYDLRREVMDDRFRTLMAFEVARARRYYASARPLVGFIERNSRPAFWTMYESYNTILNHIEACRYDVFSVRAKLNPRDAFTIILKALLKW
jgi:phytoene synthase